MKRRGIAGFIVLAAVILALSSGAEAGFRWPFGQASRSSRDVAGVFDYYLLTLSWSPTYCLVHSDDSAQCGNKGYGFVLHGLWPQYRRGGFPQDCAIGNRLTAEAVAFGKTIFPSPKLIEHEWRKHGTCSGLDALTYFKTADQIRSAIKIPPTLESPSQTRSTNLAEIVSAFQTANPGLPERALAVICHGPELAEVRVCVDRKQGLQTCGNGVKSNCGNKRIRVPAAR